MPPLPRELYWIPNAVANVLHNNGISDDIDSISEAIEMPRTTVYRARGRNWDGKVTIPILAAMAARFRVPMAHLVTEPASWHARRLGK